MLKERKKQEAEERAKRNELLIKFMSYGWLLLIFLYLVMYLVKMTKGSGMSCF